MNEYVGFHAAPATGLKTYQAVGRSGIAAKTGREDPALCLRGLPRRPCGRSENISGSGEIGHCSRNRKRGSCVMPAWASTPGL